MPFTSPDRTSPYSPLAISMAKKNKKHSWVCVLRESHFYYKSCGWYINFDIIKKPIGFLNRKRVSSSLLSFKRLFFFSAHNKICELRHMYVINLSNSLTVYEQGRIACFFTKVSRIVITGTVQVHRLEIRHKRLDWSLVHARSTSDDVKVIEKFQ